jgi:hypothetical protein
MPCADAAKYPYIIHKIEKAICLDNLFNLFRNMFYNLISLCVIVMVLELMRIM